MFHQTFTISFVYAGIFHQIQPYILLYFIDFSDEQIQVERSSISLAFKELSAFLFFFGRAVLALAVDALPFVVLVFLQLLLFLSPDSKYFPPDYCLWKMYLNRPKKRRRNPNFHLLHWMNFPRFPPLLCYCIAAGAGSRDQWCVTC